MEKELKSTLDYCYPKIELLEKHFISLKPRLLKLFEWKWQKTQITKISMKEGTLLIALTEIKKDDEGIT